MRRMLSAMASVAGLVVGAAALAQAPAGAGAAVETGVPVEEYRLLPRGAFRQVLLGIPAVQDELKLTEGQKKANQDTVNRHFERMQKALREATDREKMEAAREAQLRAIAAALVENLEPWQRDRLDQIQIQAQGPLAFHRSAYPLMAWDGPDLAERLKLTDDQVTRVRAIAEEGIREIGTAALVPIVIDPKAGDPTAESIRKLLDSPEFQASTQKAREAARGAWTRAMRRLEEVLTEPQRTAYHAMLGAPFDLSRIRRTPEMAARDADMVLRAFNARSRGGSGGGQQADPSFDTKVARPAYTKEHPPVLFDEAHHNFHTTAGRYKPFAAVIASDGYRVIPSKDPFTKEVLAKGNILIIANALGAEGMGTPNAAHSAFTDAECDAVRDWVKGGGSLLLITDHAPFGSAAESLAGRFGVDMSKGFTADPSNSEGGPTSLVFTRKNNLLGDHPIMKGRDDTERVNRVQTFTGQSLKGPAGSVSLLKLADTAVDQNRDGPPTSAAGRAQGLAFAFGKGRVVVLGEAAELSAQLIGTQRFGMNVPGLDNRQMALNIMHWLSGLLEPRGGQPD